jgi:hypothetical protein
MITISINADMVDLSRIEEWNGKRYIKFSLIEGKKRDANDNDYFITQTSTKEERQQRIRMPIIGNGKIWPAPERPPTWDGAVSPGQPQPTVQPPEKKGW